MAKNLIPEIAKMLGVEIGETFYIKEPNNNAVLYKITDTGLFSICQGRESTNVYEPIMFCNIIAGDIEIIKLPWEPKQGECYFHPEVLSKRVGHSRWIGDNYDYAFKALGMIYRTKAEAKAHFAKDYRKLTGRKLEGYHGRGKEKA